MIFTLKCSVLKLREMVRFIVASSSVERLRDSEKNLIHLALFTNHYLQQAESPKTYCTAHKQQVYF
jgi:hypothetical protein